MLTVGKPAMETIAPGARLMPPGSATAIGGLRRAALFLVAAAAGLSGLGQPALAQTGTGQSGHSTSAELGNVKLLGDLAQFGRCFAATERKWSLALLQTKPGSNEENEVYRKMTRLDQPCLFGGTQMSSSVVYIRGAIAEGLVKEGGVPADMLLPAPSADRVTTLSEAARCYVSRHRREVKALIDMKLGTKEEVAAVGALWPGLRTCIPKRASVRLNALWIRYLLAEALLRTADPAAPGNAR